MFAAQPDAERAVRAIAQAIIRNPNWTSQKSAVLAARVRTQPLLVAFGSFSRIDLARLHGLSLQLEFALSHTRYLDWPAVEEAVVRLAHGLTERFGADEVSGFRFCGVPRGGMIVLGLLSYALDLSPQQLVRIDEALQSEETLVIVDDCALTGVRFRQHLARTSAQNVVFCPLLAIPDLCRAIEAAEPKVAACVVAEELHDWAPELYGAGYDAWRSGWAERKRGHSYWGGRPDHIGFPWSEPQTSFWNSVTGEMEPGWDILPADRCFKHRAGATVVEADSLQLCTPGPGPVRPADHVLWAQINDAIVVAAVPVDAAAAQQAADRPTGPDPDPQPSPCLRLEGTAADMWDALLECGTMEAATAKLADVYDVDLPTLRRDLANFVTTLQNDGILTGA